MRLHTLFKHTIFDFTIYGGVNVCVFNVPLGCTEEEKKMQAEGLQKMLNALDKCRKVGKFCVHFYSILFYSNLLRLIIVN